MPSAPPDPFADLSSWRKLAVTGRDALAWLDSLVSADIADLEPGRASRSLLLSPTGRIRAEFTVAVVRGTIVLFQDPVQPRSIGDLLAPYVLSSDVEVEDRTEELALFAFPGLPTPPDVPGADASLPSCLGRGADVTAPVEDHDRLLTSFGRRFRLASAEEVDTFRVLAGIPRFGVDGREDDLPQEAGLAGAVSFGKGCYLGQEAVAKVQNLGHPRRVVLALEGEGPIAPGERIEAGGAVGEVTSAASSDGLAAILARVPWAGREGPFVTERGVELRPRTT